MPRTRHPKKVQITGQFHPNIAAQIRADRSKPRLEHRRGHRRMCGAGPAPAD